MFLLPWGGSPPWLEWGNLVPPARIDSGGPCEAPEGWAATDGSGSLWEFLLTKPAERSWLLGVWGRNAWRPPPGSLSAPPFGPGVVPQSLGG